MEQWLNSLLPCPIVMHIPSVILGNKDEIMIDCIFVITKHEIYKSKWNQSDISIEEDTI